MTTTLDRKGGRRIDLWLPFDFAGQKIESVYLRPFLFQHSRRWREGRFANSMALLLELTEMSAACFDEIADPDIRRIFEQYMSMLPDDIRNDIGDGVVPQPAADRPRTEAGLPPGDAEPSENPDADAHGFSGLEP